MQLSGLLEDESAVTVRLALSALKLCMPSLSHSYQSSLAMKLLFAVMQVKHNSYWLVKVSYTNNHFISACALLSILKAAWYIILVVPVCMYVCLSDDSFRKP